jgi:hypothetical protein
MGYPVYYGGEVHITPPLGEEDATVLLAVANLEETEESRALFAAIKSGPEPDLPHYAGLLEVSEDRTCIVPEGEESRHGLRMWLRLLIEHMLGPRGYVLSGEIWWRAGDDSDDRGCIYVKENQLEAVDDFLFNPGPSWSPSPFADGNLKRAIEGVLESADGTGCSSDLVVVAATHLEDLRSLFEKL